MKKAIVFCILFASFALAQKQSIAVIPTQADPESKLTPKQLDLLTDAIRSVILKNVPLDKFSLMKQDEVRDILGDSVYVSACEEGKCVGSFVDSLGVNFGARCDIYTIEQTYLKCELYSKTDGTIGEIPKEAVKNFAEMEAMISKKGPAMFIRLTKSPQEICIADGNVWKDGVCMTAEKMAQNACEQQGNTWIGGACKSEEQIICEAQARKKWVGNECKTPEQIACESKAGNAWVNGVCRSQTATPPPVAVAPAASGTYTAYIVTEPANASLNLNGTPYPSCPRTPCPIALYENRVKISAILNDYETADTTLTITTPNQNVNIKLRPKTYSVSFASEPSGASLSVEGEGRCETPCSMYLKKGRVKVSAGTDNYYERKDTTITITGSSRLNLKLNPNYGTLDIKGAGYGWSFYVGDKYLPIDNIRLLPGSYKAQLTHEDYEDIDFSVDIKKNERKSFDISDKIVHRFGYLNVRPAYSEGLGENENWDLTIDGRSYSIGNVKLLPGEHEVRLTHRCYEDIKSEAKIERGDQAYFDMQDKLALKQGTLVLRVKRKVRNLSKPVFVNGKQVGQTPYEASIPLCSEIKIGMEGGEERVPVTLEHNKPVAYTYKDGTFKSHLLGTLLDITGVVFLYMGYEAFNARDSKYHEYSDMKVGGSQNRSQYDGAWEDVKEYNSLGNTLLIVGGVALTLGIGVHIWF